MQILAVHSRQSLGTLMDIEYPHAKRSEGEWLILVEQAKAEAPEYVKTTQQRADWMRYFIEKKINNG
jgi:hypothetical protein